MRLPLEATIVEWSNILKIPKQDLVIASLSGKLISYRRTVSRYNLLKWLVRSTNYPCCVLAKELLAIDRERQGIVNSDSVSHYRIH